MYIHLIFYIFVSMPNLNIISLFDKNTVKHLRLPFSYHLMPVFLFAWSQAVNVNMQHTLIAFLILHLLIYPSSNGYNSYQDKDETSIGGLKNPPKVSENLFYATLLLDFIGVLLALFVSVYFSVFVLLYVLISRAYSYRNLRLKKYALIGFLTVFLFQGAFTYLMVSSALSDFNPRNFFTPGNVICMSVASLFIGSVYPLTQIYQHAADKKDGVTTISYKLGYVGTFIFSALMFTLATVLLLYYFDMKHQRMSLVLFFTMMLPVVIRLFMWFSKVRENSSNANFENTMSMNLLASTCMNAYFAILILNNSYCWF
ncbi:MAG: Prenyltransferase [Bacteroidetes bacterium]|nr:Prenyltransferase [Bacteroidota bacterium]